MKPLTKSNVLDLSFCVLIYYGVWLAIALISVECFHWWRAYTSGLLWELSSDSPVWHDEIAGFEESALQLAMLGVFPALLHNLTLSMLSAYEKYFWSGRNAVLITSIGTLLLLYLIGIIAQSILLLLFAPIFLAPCILAGLVTNRHWANTP